MTSVSSITGAPIICMAMRRQLILECLRGEDFDSVRSSWPETIVRKVSLL